MAVQATIGQGPRWVRTFHGADTLSDDLVSMGASVGPRKGPNRRTQGEMEDYVLRRLIVAWCRTASLEFPVTIEAAAAGAPDFVLSWPDGETRGLEITESGTEEHQARLTASEDATAPGEVEMMPGDGWPGDAPERRVAADLIKALRCKVEKFDDGAYRGFPSGCDLAIYNNSEAEILVDLPPLIRSIEPPTELLGQFKQIHLVSGGHVVLDAFGNDRRLVDLSRDYDIDYAGWALDQAARVRRREADDLDFDHVAEELESLGRSERRALGSHVRNLLLHLLKWQFQPDRRSESWRSSIENARAEIDELRTEMPSLVPHLPDIVKAEYARARRSAARETGLSPTWFPEACPYQLGQLLDPEFLP